MQRMFLCARLPDVSSLFLNWIDENMLPKTLVWIPTAAYQEGDSSFVRARKSFFEIHGFSVEILELAEAEPAYAKNILKQARVLYISGGNTFFLLKEFQKCDLLDYRWIAKVTSSLHDLLLVTEKSCKTKFRISWAGNKNPEVNFTNIAET